VGGVGAWGGGEGVAFYETRDGEGVRLQHHLEQPPFPIVLRTVGCGCTVARRWETFFEICRQFLCDTGGSVGHDGAALAFAHSGDEGVDGERAAWGVGEGVGCGGGGGEECVVDCAGEGFDGVSLDYDGVGYGLEGVDWFVVVVVGGGGG